jgi:HEXXH motif-containing protein
MFDETFDEYAAISVVRGQHRFAQLARTLLRERNPEVCERLDFDHDEAFLEPLLFAYLTMPEAPMPVEQILAGYFSDEGNGEPIQVRSDATGVIYMPRIGYVRTNRPHRTFSVTRGEHFGAYFVEPGSSTVAHEVEAPLTVADGAIEVLRSAHPLLQGLYIDRCGEVAEIEVVSSARTHAPHLATALEIIGRYLPVCFHLVANVTRKINIFTGQGMNSFAALRAHGLAFLNASQGADEVFFLEDVAHQCGHIVFNAMTFEADELFVVPPDSPLSEYTGRAGERRTLYEALHGVFTEALMFHCLAECDRRDLFTGRQQHELIGRLGFVIRRFGGDLSSLSRGKHFTDHGEWLFGNILKVFRVAYERYIDRIEALDFSNQPYNFSYELFAELNPQ